MHLPQLQEKSESPGRVTCPHWEQMKRSSTCLIIGQILGFYAIRAAHWLGHSHCTVRASVAVTLLHGVRQYAPLAIEMIEKIHVFLAKNCEGRHSAL
jgi:hypothetical protein